MYSSAPRKVEMGVGSPVSVGGGGSIKSVVEGGSQGVGGGDECMGRWESGRWE